MSDSNNKEFRRFGKYLILDHLVDGGMAKICRARFLGEQADKIVAIKMIQPQFSKDPNFTTMFMDEIKVCFGLLHPTIAQTYDYGMIDDQLFTAMEYVDGANLKQFIDRLRQRKFVFPVEISCHIISQVCQALDYAHNFTNKLTGEKANIIHRDISPHNVMLTYDGSVKVIDFGIAKAESNSEATQAGTIKGKLSYLAPEYLEGLKLDHRYDQFAVGITLWELLCCRKLFHAENDLAVLKQIQACKIPAPSKINPNVPKELDQIVLKSLSKDRNKRYENMDQFNRALVKFLYSNYPDFNATDLAYFAKELFKDEIKADRAKLIEFGKIDIRPYLDDLSKGTSSDTNLPSNGKKGSKKGGTQRIEFEMDLSEASNAEAFKLDKGKKDSTKTKTKIKLQGKTQGTGNKAKSKPSPAVKGGTQKVKVNKLESGKKKFVTSKKGSGGGGFGSVIKLALVASLAGFVYLKQDLVKEMTGVDIGEYVPALKRGPASTTKKKAVVKEGLFSMVGFDPLMELHLNNQKMKYDTLGISLPLGKKFDLRVTKEGHESFRTSFTLTENEPNLTVTIPPLKEYQYGELQTSRNYTPGSTLTVEIDGREITKKLPVSGYRMPAGNYEGIISDPVLNTKKRVQFTILENQKNMLPK